MRDYLYIPLGGGRKGFARQFLSLVVTMLLGGVARRWLDFRALGCIAWIYLILNYGWRMTVKAVWPDALDKSSAIGRTIARLVTFVAVVTAWVFFRADGSMQRYARLHARSGAGGVSIPLGFHGRMRGLEEILVSLGIQFSGQSVIPVGDWLP